MFQRVSAPAAAGLVLSVLVGCVSPEEVRRADEAACAGYGFQPGTTDFASCLQRESLARRYPPHDPFWWSSPYWPPPPYWRR
jgi:hypothetical protein